MWRCGADGFIFFIVSLLLVCYPGRAGDMARIDDNECLGGLENGTESIVCTGEQIEKL